MTSFLNLNEIVKQFQTDPESKNDPVKRMFICDGESISANIASSSGNKSKLHTQPDHDEIVIVIDGDAEFKIVDEIRRVGPGDFMFIPRNTLHGRVRTLTESMSALSIYAPYFNRAKENIIWDKNQFSDTTKDNTITVANLAVGSGIDTKEIISKLLLSNNNLKIIIYCFDTSPILLQRALDNLTMFKRQISFELHEKNIELQFHFSNITLGEQIGLPDSSIDLVIANYILHFIPNESCDNFFLQIASLIKNNGLFLMSQIVSISENVPHPITPLLQPFKNFHGIPTINEIKEHGKKHFKEVKDNHLSTNWSFRKPRK